MSAIIEELAEIVKAGSLGEETVSMDAIKEIIMKDLEIFLDESILHEIDKKLNPPQEQTGEMEEETEASETVEAEGAGEDEAEKKE